MLALHKAMDDLARRRPVFHAEADFQHALAWHLRRSGAVDDVRLEKPLNPWRARGLLEALEKPTQDTLGLLGRTSVDEEAP